MNDFLSVVIFLVISLLTFLYWRSRKAREFFDQNGIPYLPPTFLVGNVGQVIWEQKPMPAVHMELYKKLEPHSFAGYLQFNKPMIMIREPELIKDVLIKNFTHFHDRSIPINPKVDRISNNLLTMKGDEWKKHRINLTTTFTSGKMKIMFPLLKECGEKCAKLLESMTSEPINIKDLFLRFNCNVIATCAFGIETHSLHDPDSEFMKIGRRLFKFSYRNIMAAAFPKMPESLARLLNFRFVDVEVQNFFLSLVKNTVQYREDNKITRNDFIDLLLSLKNKTMSKYQDKYEHEDVDQLLSQIGDKHSKSEIEMTSDAMAAQCFVFFGAGFETSSSALGFLMLELAQNQDIQDKVRNEINTVIANNPEGFTYELLMEMPYVDMVISETLRKYPATGFLVRECTEDYTIPNTNIVIPRNATITVPIYGLHLDPKYYEKPEQFYPEHFTKEAIAKRPNYTYMPFGEGPRVCIGYRFAKMQMKVALISVMRDFKFELSPKTKLPIKFQQHFVILKAKDGIWLECKKINP